LNYGGRVNAHCCAMMSSNIAEGETAIRYFPKFREYGVPVLDGGSSNIAIHYCPCCGRLLPASLRNKWFEEIETRGYKNDIDIPAEFNSDAWWKLSSTS
jgi:hypothetical protein